MDSYLEDSVFDASDASSDFAPAPRAKAKPVSKPKATSTKSAVASKPAAAKKSQAASSKAKPGPKKRARPGIDDEDAENALDGPESGESHDASILSATPPSAQKAKKVKVAPTKKATSTAMPLADVQNGALSLDGTVDSPALPSSAGKGKKATSSDRYQKLTQLEHITKRPDTYIGSVERIETKLWVYNSERDTMEMREISFVPGLYKIFDEILVNAADNKQNDKNMDTIKVTINKEKGQISVWNNGRGIPIEIHSKEKIYIPEMIFGHLLTSSNYDDEQQKVTGGRNGYGAKLCNVFSTKFTLETASNKNKKIYKQTWTHNMSKMGEAAITAQKGGLDYTQVTFTPDYRRFGMEGIDDDFEALVKRRVYDMAGTCKGVKVYLNGQRIGVKKFKDYMEMYTKAIKLERGEEAANDASEMVTDSADNGRWEVGFAVSDGSFQQVSFVNSIATTSGGTHVNYIADQICDFLGEEMKKKKNKGGAVLKPGQIKNHLFVFVNSQIVNPAFTSQTKEQLTTKVSQFGSKFVLSPQFLKKIVDKTQVLENIKSFAAQKADQILKKSDGNRRSRMDNPKLTDANKAGTKDGWQCTLILTEGDSAKGLAMTGRSIVGPDLFGVFPLRGKLLNVRDATVDQVAKNAEIQNIKNILGLKHKQVYTDCRSLRYGHIMIMTDQDHDGSHIKGLLMNFLQVQYPSLLKIPKFLIEFITPIVKVYKGDSRKPTKSATFFTIPEYEAWKEIHKHERGWESKYYKGLGTSSDEDAEKYFRDLDRHLKEFHAMQENEPELFELAFSKKKADERKEWLRQFRPGTYLDHSMKEITYSDFVNKELILFSMADNMRSIPSVVDGFKPGQRKVLFACLKRNLHKDMKVVELAGHIMGLTAYHHGEASLQQTIVGLAQTFVGSNNLHFLEPSGNFGSRLQGGSDSASARYIFTRLSPFTKRVFHPLDEPLLKHHTDEGRIIEPENYVPVVPMILINGADGIGTGWSSQIPNYNPADVVNNLRAMMRGEEPQTMTPWFRDFDGTIEPIGPDKFKCSGIAKQTGPHEVEVTELPIRTWTQDYKDRLVEIIKAEKTPSWIKDYDDYNTKTKVNFAVRLEDKHMQAALNEGLLEKFKLTKTISTTNLVAFDAHGRITKYANVEEILKAFFDVRIKVYERRKAHQLSEMGLQLEKLTNQARFVQMIIDGKLVVAKKRKRDLVLELKSKNFKAFPKVADATKDGALEDGSDDKEEKDVDDEIEASANAFDYLLGMAIWSLTHERLEKLKRQIREKQDEIDELIKLSREDLWSRDLDDFMAEWDLQLQEEKLQRKKIQGMKRRVSAKLRTQVGPTSRKRKVDDSGDSDFDVKPKKKDLKKSEPIRGALTSYLLSGNPSAKPASALATKPLEKPKAPPKEEDDGLDIWQTLDGATGPTRAPAKALPSRAASEDVADGPVAARGARGARKPVKYAMASDSDDDEDDMEFDVGNMVKGIGMDAGASSSNRPLFAATASAARPGSSAGLARKSFGRDRVAQDTFEDNGADDTDYKLLAPTPNGKGPATAKAIVLSDDENDEDGELEHAFKAPTSKASTNKATAAISKSKAGPAGSNSTATKSGTKGNKTVSSKPKTTVSAKAAPAVAKVMTLSPAAKAYAAKQAQRKPVDSDDDMDMEMEGSEAVANALLSDDDDEEVSVKPTAGKTAAAGKASTSARPARRAAATASKKKWVVDDDDDDGEDEDDDDDEGLDDTADFEVDSD